MNIVREINHITELKDVINEININKTNFNLSISFIFFNIYSILILLTCLIIVFNLFTYLLLTFSLGCCAYYEFTKQKISCLVGLAGLAQAFCWILLISTFSLDHCPVCFLVLDTFLLLICLPGLTCLMTCLSEDLICLAICMCLLNNS